MDLRREIFKLFKAKGLSIRPDASYALESVLSKEYDPRSSLETILDEVKLRIEKRFITSNVIDVNVITTIVAELSSNDDDLNQESLELFDAFYSPKLTYDEKQRTYRVLPKTNYNLFGVPEDRANMFKERLLFTIQRMLRSGLFSVRGLKSDSASDDKHELSYVSSLLGSRGSRVLLGIITQPEEAQWHLEDLTGSIRLDLSQAQTYPVLFTEGSIVIVQGSLELGGIFQVQVMGFPPAEERNDSIGAMGITDLFGSGWRPQHLQQLQDLESNAQDTMFIILSDVQLDRPVVMDKLLEVFQGFEGTEGNIIFILIGNFITKPITVPGGRDHARNTFKTLGEIIASCPQLANEAKFVLVPGPTDPGLSSALPRRPLPEILVKDLIKNIPNISFASNPCRIRFFTQEIVIYREDLLKKMQRHTIVPLMTSEDAPEITEQIVQSILDQGHLSPLPLSSRPIYWNLDHTLRLFPLPHLLILADHAEQYSLSYKGCSAVNPGSFASDFSFVVYRPAQQEVEFSKVPV